MQVENSEELVADPIFCNDSILVGNKTVFYKKWIDKGVCFIKNILNENGTFMLFKRFKEIYRINTGGFQSICNFQTTLNTWSSNARTITLNDFFK